MQSHFNILTFFKVNMSQRSRFAAILLWSPRSENIVGLVERDHDDEKSSSQLSSSQVTVHSTQFTVHRSQFTVHSTQYTVHSSQFTGHSEMVKRGRVDKYRIPTL